MDEHADDALAYFQGDFMDSVRNYSSPRIVHEDFTFGADIGDPEKRNIQRYVAYSGDIDRRKYWLSKDRHIMRLKSLEDSHLQNCISLAVRLGKTQWLPGLHAERDRRMLSIPGLSELSESMKKVPPGTYEVRQVTVRTGGLKDYKTPRAGYKGPVEQYTETRNVDE